MTSKNNTINKATRKSISNGLDNTQKERDYGFLTSPYCGAPNIEPRGILPVPKKEQPVSLREAFEELEKTKGLPELIADITIHETLDFILGNMRKVDREFMEELMKESVTLQERVKTTKQYLKEGHTEQEILEFWEDARKMGENTRQKLGLDKR